MTSGRATTGPRIVHDARRTFVATNLPFPVTQSPPSAHPCLEPQRTPMKIAIPVEIDPAEPRVAATPDTVKKMKALGAEVAVEPGAGIKSGILDADYAAAGAAVAADAVTDADVVLKVRRPTADELKRYKKGALVIAIMDPFGNERSEEHTSELQSRF